MAAHAAADHAQVGELVLLGRVVEAVVQQREQVLVEDLALPVGQGGELAVDLAELRLGQLVAQLAEAALQRMAAGVLAEHQGRARDADHLGPDDLVGEPVLQHAVLVDAGLVGEGVAADDRLVGLGKDAGQVGEQLAGAVDLPRLHVAAGSRARRRAPGEAITISSSAALPARSPIPLTVHST